MAPQFCLRSTNRARSAGWLKPKQKQLKCGQSIVFWFKIRRSLDSYAVPAFPLTAQDWARTEGNVQRALGSKILAAYGRTSNTRPMFIMFDQLSHDHQFANMYIYIHIYIYIIQSWDPLPTEIWYSQLRSSSARGEEGGVKEKATPIKSSI